MNHPTFLVIGAQKAGTTSLYHALRQHPQIFMSDNKEPHFFLAESLKAWQYYPGQQIRLWADRVTRPAAYHALFDGVTTETAIGEASVWYLYRPEVAARLKRALPQVKLIALLRDPVERCFSDFKQGLSLGYESETDFLTAVQADQQRRGNACHYVAQGFYYQQISRYLNLFDPSQLKLCLYEDLRDQPQQLLQDIFRFLEVDDQFQPDTSVKQNISASYYRKLSPKQRVLQGLWGDKPAILPQPPTDDSAADETESPASRHRLKKLPTYATLLLTSPTFRRRLALWSLQRGGMLTEIPFKPTLTPEARAYLINLYRADIHQLQAHLQRDLSAWLN